MRRFLLIALAAALPGLINAGPRPDAAIANPFDEGRLQDKTLRIDYMFTGSDKDCDIAVAELLSAHGWYGRRTNLKEVPLRGNGQLTMTDKATGDTLYRMSFCTLFQEWQATEEATRVRKSFENVFLGADARGPRRRSPCNSMTFTKMWRQSLRIRLTLRTF